MKHGVVCSRISELQSKNDSN